MVTSIHNQTYLLTINKILWTDYITSLIKISFLLEDTHLAQMTDELNQE